MRGLAETGPLEGFPVSLLKIRQRSSPKLGVSRFSGPPCASKCSRPLFEARPHPGKYRKIRSGSSLGLAPVGKLPPFTFPPAWGTLTPGFM